MSILDYCLPDKSHTLLTNSQLVIGFCAQEDKDYAIDFMPRENDDKTRTNTAV